MEIEVKQRADGQVVASAGIGIEDLKPRIALELTDFQAILVALEQQALNAGEDGLAQDYSKRLVRLTNLLKDVGARADLTEFPPLSKEDKEDNDVE